MKTVRSIDESFIPSQEQSFEIKKYDKVRLLIDMFENLSEARKQVFLGRMPSKGQIGYVQAVENELVDVYFKVEKGTICRVCKIEEIELV